LLSGTAAGPPNLDGRRVVAASPAGNGRGGSAGRTEAQLCEDTKHQDVRGHSTMTKRAVGG
jgi:hypothetical protein